MGMNDGVAELAGSPILTIAGSAASDVWLGGAGGALWHWDGKEYAVVRTWHDSSYTT